MSQEENGIKISQIVAALGLLELKQEDLAKAVGITETALSRIMRGHTQARPRTFTAILEALEKRGIEFTNGNSPGVRYNPEKAIIPKSNK